MRLLLQSVLVVLIFICLGIGAGWLLLQTDIFTQILQNHTVAQTVGVRKTEVLGFLPYWLVGKVNPDEFSRLTTLTYFSLTIGDDGHIVKNISPQEPEIGLSRLSNQDVQTALQRAASSGARLSLCVTDQREKSIAQLIQQDPVLHARNLVTDVVPIMRDQHFLDLNIDIESFATASQSARQNFSTFIETVKTELSSQVPGATVSIDVLPAAAVNSLLFDLPRLGEIVDQVVLMTYDYSYRGSLVSGPVAPVGGAPEVRNFDVTTAVRETLLSIPKQKLLLGIPLYGYQWDTLSASPSAAIVPGTGQTVGQANVVAKISDCAQHGPCSQGIDETAQQPYLILPGDTDGVFTHIFYEDEISFRRKIEVAKQFKLGGVGLWALGYEDMNMLRGLETYKQFIQW